MRATLACVVWLAFAVPQQPPGREAPLVPLGERAKLRALGSDLARSGEREALARLRAALLALGDEEDDLELLDEGWERAFDGAKSRSKSRAPLIGKLCRVLGPLTASLADEGQAHRTELARALLGLDSEEATARTALGYVRGLDGAWLTEEEARWEDGARAVERLVRSARTLDFDIERRESRNATLLAVAGGGNSVRAGGVVLHSTLDFERLERILRQALRAADLSLALTDGVRAVRGRKERHFVVFSTQAQFRHALDEAVAHRRLSQRELEETLRLGLYGYFDLQGFEVVRWLEEATLSAVILWRLQEDWIPREAQPCLRVGHLSWVCLHLLGASLPEIAWREEPADGAGQRSSAARTEESRGSFLWRTARRTPWGCRAWMMSQALEGRDPPWARSMLDQDGKIRDEALLKTTIVCELLQQEGRLAGLMKTVKAAQEPAPAFERALGESLPDLEARWRRWLLPERLRGVLQELEAEPPESAPSRATDALRALNQARARALAGQDPEVTQVELDAELSRAAELHARYLSANPDQKERWPGVHEEYADAPGFTPEGALAGSRALVSFGRDPTRAIAQWLGSFYHRLPLLHPGLFGAGLGSSEEVVALDVKSLVLAPWKDHVVLWPLPGAEDVPRAFVPELPSPVPGEDLALLGQAVSVQLFFVRQEEDVELALELFAGDLTGRPVEAFVLSPSAPLQTELVPHNAWGLIPKRWLEARTRYTARARWSGGERVWSFTTGE